MNPWIQVVQQGQSVWLDFMRRQLLLSGEFKRLIDEDGISGATANPTIFEQAIVKNEDYDERIRELLDEGADQNRIYEDLAIADIQMAADALSPTWEARSGADGYMSIEVSPKLLLGAWRRSGERRRSPGLGACDPAVTTPL